MNPKLFVIAAIVLLASGCTRVTDEDLRVRARWMDACQEVLKEYAPREHELGVRLAQMKCEQFSPRDFAENRGRHARIDADLNKRLDKLDETYKEEERKKAAATPAAPTDAPASPERETGWDKAAEAAQARQDAGAAR